MSILRKLLLAGLAFGLCMPCILAAESGRLRVVVYDAKDKTPLPGATVILSHPNKVIKEAALITDKKGEAFFPVLPARKGYILTVQFPGYQGLRMEIQVKLGQEERIPVYLGEENVETVNVVAKEDVVDLQDTRQTTKFNDEFIESLPVQGRAYTGILTMAPGVQDSDGDGNPNVHGARERDFKAVVGGVANVDPLTGLRLNNINIDSIEEIEVVQAGAGVEYGRAQGGYANIIEKTGSNTFEGLFSFTFRSHILDGNGATNLTSDRIPEFEWIQPALQLSGPIIRDRLWYRLSHEYLKLDQPVDTLGQVAVVTTERTLNSDLITWQVSPKNRLSFAFQLEPQTVTNVGVSSTTPPESSFRNEFKGPVYRLTWDAPYSPRLLLKSVVAYQDAEVNILPSTEGIPNNCVQGITAFEFAQCFNVITGQRSGSYFISHRDQRQRFTVDTRGDWYAGRFLGAEHQVKFGLSVENERYFRDLERRPDMTFFILQLDQDSNQGGGGDINLRGIANIRFAVPDSSQARAVGTTWGFFAADQIRPLSNLTVNLGVRVDKEMIEANGREPFDPEAQLQQIMDFIADDLTDPFLNIQQVQAKAGPLMSQVFTVYEDMFGFLQGAQETIPGAALSGLAVQTLGWPKRRRPDNIDISNTNVSPFFSFSWDPFKTGKTKIAGAVGKYYDKLFLSIPLVELEPITTDVQLQLVQRQGGWFIPNCNGCVLEPTGNTTVVDRNLRTPYQKEWTLSFERELGRETALKVSYIRRRFRDQLQDVDINHRPGDFGRCEISGGSFRLTPSPGGGQMLVDPATGETYEDTDPGIGDGIIDDCVGRFEIPDTDPGGGGGGAGGVVINPGQDLLHRPDGFPDSYIMNPAWGEIFLVGNFNTADYRGVVLELVRRLYRGWQMEASYTWSKAVGDAEDFLQVLGDDRSLLEDERGFLSYDQRHVVKVNATSQVPWWGGFRLGLSAQWQSGLPYSLLVRRSSIDSVPPFIGLASPKSRVRLRYITRQRNDQRNESYWNFDVHFAKEIPLQGGANVQITADVFNLLNDNSLRVLNEINGINSAFRRFGRRFQVGFKVTF